MDEIQQVNIKFESSTDEIQIPKDIPVPNFNGQFCRLCGFKPTTRNKYREIQDHTIREHFKEQIENQLSKSKDCPKCDYHGKDKQALVRHFCKHGILEELIGEELKSREIGAIHARKSQAQAENPDPLAVQEYQTVSVRASLPARPENIDLSTKKVSDIDNSAIHLPKTADKKQQKTQKETSLLNDSAYVNISMDLKDIIFCPKCGYNFRNDENSSQLNSANKKEDIISHFLRCGISMTEGKKTVKKQCHTCHKTFATQATLDSHRLFCDPSTLLCNFVAPSTTAPTNKVKKQPKKRPTVECPICHKVLNQKAYLANHMNTHTGERPHKCKFQNCDKAFKDYSSLRTHHQSHEDVRPFKCQSCDKAYRRPDDLKRHEMTHSGTNPHVCSYCAKEFKQLSTLKNHEKTAHEAPSSNDTTTPESPAEQISKISTFNCKECNQVFKSRSTLRDHEIRKHGRKGDIIKCDWVDDQGVSCSKDFTNPAILKLHKRTHTNERPFECKYCEMKFKSKFHMENHSKRHTKAGPGQLLCLACAQGFESVEELKDHQQYMCNSTEKPKYAVWYNCDICQQKFNRADKLREHTKTHEKLACAQCNKLWATEEQREMCQGSHFELPQNLDYDEMNVMELDNVDEFLREDDANQYVYN